jgi:hypothetical protein
MRVTEQSHETPIRMVCRLTAIGSPFHVRRPDQTRSLLVLPVALLLSQLKTPCPARRRLPAPSIFSYHGGLAIIITSHTSSTTRHRLLIEQMHIVNLQRRLHFRFSSPSSKSGWVWEAARAEHMEHRRNTKPSQANPGPYITPWHPDPSNSICTMLANFMPKCQSTWGRASLCQQFLSGAIRTNPGTLLPCLHFCNSFYPARVH